MNSYCVDRRVDLLLPSGRCMMRVCNRVGSVAVNGRRGGGHRVEWRRGSVLEAKAGPAKRIDPCCSVRCRSLETPPVVILPSPIIPTTTHSAQQSKRTLPHAAGCLSFSLSLRYRMPSATSHSNTSAGACQPRHELAGKSMAISAGHCEGTLEEAPTRDGTHRGTGERGGRGRQRRKA